MTVYRLASLFRPTRVLVLGAATNPVQQQLLLNVSKTLAPDHRFTLGAQVEDWTRLGAFNEVAGIELAICFDPLLLGADGIAALGASGCQALIWAGDVPIQTDQLAQARSLGLRILGARTYGAAMPKRGLNASAFTSSIKPGRVALITQSRTIAAAAVDWAEGRGVGFSWIAVTGSESDIDVADLLDFAALDPSTSAVVLQLGHVRDARKFMSAARALARLKPAVILQTGDELHAQLGQDPVRSAAFRRAGLIECHSLADLFDAIAALESLQGPQDRVAVVANGAGICALAVDALRAELLSPTDITEPAWNAMQAEWPLARRRGGALDLGATSAQDTIRLLDALLGSKDIDSVMLVHSPGPGASHISVAEALVQAGCRKSVVTVWLGLGSTGAARMLCGEAGIPTFISPESAARALAFKRLHRQTQELLSRTPPAAESIVAERERIHAEMRHMAATGVPEATAIGWLAAYGIGTAGPPPFPGKGIMVNIRQHAEMGTFLAIQACAPGQSFAEAFALPPLDQLLARRLLEEAGYRWGPNADSAVPDAPLQRLVVALVRLSQFVIEQTLVAELEVAIHADDAGGACQLSAVQLKLRPIALDAGLRLALAPYPAQLEHDIGLRDGRRMRIRAVLPSDEPRLIDMLKRTDPESIRMRYFGYLRYFSHAMAARLSQIDYDRELVLIAVPLEDGAARAAAIAQLSIGPDGSEAEFALLVQQAFAGLGLGRHLLDRLLDFAAQRGIRQVHGEVLADNREILRLCAGVGFSIDRIPEDPGCMRLLIDPARRSTRPADSREPSCETPAQSCAP